MAKTANTDKFPDMSKKFHLIFLINIHDCTFRWCDDDALALSGHVQCSLVTGPYTFICDCDGTFNIQAILFYHHCWHGRPVYAVEHGWMADNEINYEFCRHHVHCDEATGANMILQCTGRRCCRLFKTDKCVHWKLAAYRVHTRHE